MEPQKAYELAQKLGLDKNPQLARHFRNPESYLRIEDGVLEILDKYEGTDPSIMGTVSESVYGSKVKRETSLKAIDFDKAIDYFKKYYGIGCDALTQKEITELEFVPEYRISREVSFVTKFLKQNLSSLEDCLVD